MPRIMRRPEVGSGTEETVVLNPPEFNHGPGSVAQPSLSVMLAVESVPILASVALENAPAYM